VGFVTRLDARRRRGPLFYSKYVLKEMQFMKRNQPDSTRLRILASLVTAICLMATTPRTHAAATASDTACNDSIGNGNNGGSGFGAWTGVAGGNYLGASFTGESGCASSWGIYDLSGGTTGNAQRPFTSANGTANLQVGQTITVDMAYGGDGSGSEGMSLYNSSGVAVFEFYIASGNNDWTIHDNSGNNITTVPKANEPSGVRVIFTLTSSTNYSLTVQAPIGTTVINAQTGTLISQSPQAITQLRFYDYDTSNTSKNLEIGQIGVSCPTPTITTQPNSNFVFSGSTATFTVASTTAASPTYQWQTNNGSGTYVNIGSATSASYTTPATTTAMNGYLYQCVVQDACSDSVTSSVASLTVSSSTLPSVTAGPTNGATCSGSSLSLAVTASGSSLSYAWFQHTNLGWGSTWVVTNETGGTIFLGSSTNTDGATSPCSSFGNYGDINTSSGMSWGLWGGATGEQVTRMFPAALTNGQIFQINMDNGNVDTGKSVGFSLHNASNNSLFSFYFPGGQTDYGYNDSAGTHTSGVSFTRTGLQIAVIVGSGNPASYTLLITPCGGSTVGYTGTFATTGSPDILLLYNNNDTGSDTSVSDCYFNSLFAGLAYDNADNYTNVSQWSGYDRGEAFPITNSASSTFFTPTNAANGSVYYAIAYNSVGASVSTNATLTVNALPSATITDNSSDCQGSQDTFSVPAASSYSWSLSANTSGASISGSSTGSTVTVNNGGAGTYTVNVTVTSASGCVNSSSYTVTTVASPTVSNPSNESACQGNSATFTVTGTGVASYQWQVNSGSSWANVSTGSGGNTASYTTPAASTGMNGYQYWCIVAGCGGIMETSAEAGLTVYATPVGGTATPTSSSLCSGNNTTINLAGYTGSIQWQQASDDITFANVTGGSGATSASYTTPSLTSTTYYRAQVTSGACSMAYSTTNTITVSATSVGGTATAAVTNLLSGNLTTITLSGYTGSIQWQTSPDSVTYTNIPGATSATYTTPNLDQSAYYQAVLTSGACSTATSSVASVIVGTAPFVSTPLSQSNYVGTTATFSASPGGSTPFSYSWAQRTNGGWGSGNGWTVSGSGTTYLSSALGNNNGGANCSTFGSQGDINSPNTTTALGMYGGSSGNETAVRTFNALTPGQVVSIDMDNGFVANGITEGFSLQSSIGTNLLEFYFLGGGADYMYSDATGAHHTGIGYTDNGLRVVFILDSSTNYTLNVTPCGGTTSQFMGLYTNTISRLELFDNNPNGGGQNNLYFNNFVVGGYVDNADNYNSLAGGSWAGANFGDQPIASGNGASTYTTPTLITNYTGYQYEVVAYNAYGTYLSSAATLTVLLPPVAAPMTAYRTAGLPLMIALSDMATNWSDAYSYPVSLTGINLTTTNLQTLLLLNVSTNNGAFVITNIAFVGYTNGPNVNDQYSYSISDGNGGTNIGYVNIVIVNSVTGTNSIALIVPGNPTFLTAYGIPYYTYVLQRATNMASPVWINVSTNTAATNGVISASDSFSDLSGNRPVTSYYRLSWSSP
jgi:hypothetical protein